MYIYYMFVCLFKFIIKKTQLYIKKGQRCAGVSHIKHTNSDTHIILKYGLLVKLLVNKQIVFV